jgi:hypothetical protein
MMNACCLMFALVSALATASEDGAAWISKAESRLYRWQQPGSVVRFEVKTDVLDAPIAAMERDLAQKPDRDGARMVEALKKVVVHGAVDTGTGAVETQIDIACETDDPLGKASIQKLKNMLSELVRGAIAGLPLHDPTLVAKGSSVLGAQLQGDSVVITIAGRRPGEEVTLTMNRRSLLPAIIDMPGTRLGFAYEEVLPGRFAPSRLDVQPKSGPQSSAVYTWQKFENLVFPASIHLSQGPRTSNLSFQSVRVEPRSR